MTDKTLTPDHPAPMTETPETDRVWDSFGRMMLPMGHPLSVMLLHARSLETRLLAAEESRDAYRDGCNTWRVSWQEEKERAERAEARVTVLEEDAARVAQARGVLMAGMFQEHRDLYMQELTGLECAIDGTARRAAEERGKALEEALRELVRLKALINTPRTDEFFEAVRFEAAHQQERWGAEHDEGKSPPDWFWLLGYLSGKALTSFLRGDRDKGLHHIISSGAVLLNWHRHATGEMTAMRPGIDAARRLVEKGGSE